MVIKFIFFNLFLTFCSFILMSQETNADKVKWILYKEQNGVQIHYKYVECNDIHNGIFKEMLYFQFVNTVNASMNVSFDEELWYNDKCISCKTISSEYHKEFVLEPGGVSEPDCETGHNLKIFSKFLNNTKASQLSKFELINLIIKPI